MRRSTSCTGPRAWLPVNPTSRDCSGSSRTWPLRCGRAAAAQPAPTWLGRPAQIAREAGLRTQTGMLLANAGAALVRIGRWAEADRFLQMSGDAVSPTTLGSTYHLLQRSLLRLWQGDITQARADLARVLTNFPDLDPQLACPVYTQLAEVALWSDRPGEAREAAAAGLRAVEGNDDPAYVLPLCRAGLAAVATDAQRA